MEFVSVIPPLRKRQDTKAEDLEKLYVPRLEGNLEEAIAAGF